MTESKTTLQAICNAIEITLAPAVTYTQSYNELTEGMADTPRLQIYPNSGTSSPPSGNDRSSFQAKLRQSQIEIYADLYASPRSEIGEDMALLLPLMEAIFDEIEKQDTKPYFGLLDNLGQAAIKGFSWSWSRVTFSYNDPAQLYTGARFIFSLRMF